MTHLLDTNICSAHMRRPGGLAHKFMQYVGGIAIPSVVLAELFAGAYNRANPARILGFINDLLRDFPVLDFDLHCAERFGQTKAGLSRQGIAVPVADLMIASIALVHNLTLVTHNTADFHRVPGLRLDDWLVP
jgi:tRNA(fMet)-specific endonuclease VapC